MSDSVVSEPSSVAALEPVAALEHVAALEPLTTSVLDVVKHDLNSVVTLAQSYHAEYFLGGVLMATHTPSAAWILLMCLFTFPTALVLQNPAWITKLKGENAILVPAVFLGLAATDFYALYCLSRVVY